MTSENHHCLARTTSQLVCQWNQLWEKELAQKKKEKLAQKRKERLAQKKKKEKEEREAAEAAAGAEIES